MANITTTDVNAGSVELRDGEFEDGLLDIASSGTFPEGLILARDSVSLKFVPFVKGGSSNENGIPKAVLPAQLVADTSADQPIRALVKGVVNLNRLVILADGDASNVDAAVSDQLRSFGIVPLNVVQLSHNSADDS
jgi:hypothetical protein